jgi:F-type H+-transporting ATPase subunit epsilon
METESTMNLEIVTVDGLFLTAHADFIKLPAETGEIGILKNHAPLIARLTPGLLIIDQDGQRHQYVISEGFFEVFHNRVTIIAQDAQKCCDIDIEQATIARDSAQKALDGSRDDLQRKKARADLARWEAWVKAGCGQHTKAL